MGLKDHLPDDFVYPEESSATPEFWNHFWREGVAPWDLGKPHPELQHRISEFGEPGPAYVPGCGKGHDAIFLANNNWQVTAVDHAQEVRPHLMDGLLSGSCQFLSRDAFDLASGESYRLWWDHTFFCAIPPAKRATWGASVRSVFPHGGILAAIVFPYGKKLEEGGPPFGFSAQDMLETLGSRAELVTDSPITHPGREGGERFALFKVREDPSKKGIKRSSERLVTSAK